MINDYVEGYFHASRVDGQLIVDEADDFVTIPHQLWSMMVAGDACPEVLAGEGILVIRALNGTYRYDLTGERNELGAWLMRRVT